MLTALSLYVATGLASGILAGLLGMSGGLVLVPALYSVFISLHYGPEYAVHTAVATSLAAVMFTSAFSIYQHHQLKRVDWYLLRRCAPFIVGGVAIGIFVVNQLNTSYVLAGFSFLTILFALYVMFAPADIHICNGLPKKPVPELFSTFIGFLSAIFGIGGSTIVVPSMLVCNVNIQRAIATSSGMGILVGVPATLGSILIAHHDKNPLGLGHINIVALACPVPMSLIGVKLGVRVHGKVDEKMLKRLFAAFLAIMAAKLSYESFGLFTS